ncbi:MAG TPA: lactose ABC transporter permease [Lachnospiraceae bacterium]|jgi:lactose/L-arabinose transport system permease protein|nr:lactose ABC transporter permease [Lachnospiraceae bacterium]HCA69417.1 lactose ABC transporter permease [Lachnospiraceae bacterium]HCM12506.1 lactose ABC transporter permease [Lachnospiraceae bacterium]HCR40974.1 lactose ABC transporter permease [Lachnospiraceae bacterium]
MKRGKGETKSLWRRLNSLKNFPYFLIAPTVIIFVVFMVYPIVYSLILSFQEFKHGTYSFVGLKNYIVLFKDPIFYKALMNTFFYLIVQVPIMIGLALIIAVFVEEKHVKGKAFWRTSIFLPSITALVAYALVFKVLFNGDYGLINYVISALGGDKVQWFYSKWPARFSIIISITWRWTGYNMIILLAGLQAIPESVYESAAIDGAGFWKKLTYITVPMVKPILLFTTITSTIGTLQLFDEPYVLTQGGPDYATITIGQYLYNNGFVYMNFGYASAIGYVMVFIIGILSVLQFKIKDN